MITYLAGLKMNDFPHSKEKGESEKQIFGEWFEKKRDGDAVDAPRRRRPSPIEDAMEDASAISFRKHTLKVLGGRRVEGRKRR